MIEAQNTVFETKTSYTQTSLILQPGLPTFHNDIVWKCQKSATINDSMANVQDFLERRFRECQNKKIGPKEYLHSKPQIHWYSTDKDQKYHTGKP